MSGNDAERDPAKLPHKANGIELALECTGFFADRDGGQKHIDAGADFVAVCKAVWGAEDPVAAVVRFNEVFAL